MNKYEKERIDAIIKKGFYKGQLIKAKETQGFAYDIVIMDIFEDYILDIEVQNKEKTRRFINPLYI